MADGQVSVRDLGAVPPFQIGRGGYNIGIGWPDVGDCRENHRVPRL